MKDSSKDQTLNVPEWLSILPGKRLGLGMGNKEI